MLWLYLVCVLFRTHCHKVKTGNFTYAEDFFTCIKTKIWHRKISTLLEIKRKYVIRKEINRNVAKLF